MIQGLGDCVEKEIGVEMRKLKNKIKEKIRKIEERMAEERINKLEERIAEMEEKEGEELGRKREAEKGQEIRSGIIVIYKKLERKEREERRRNIIPFHSSADFRSPLDLLR